MFRKIKERILGKNAFRVASYFKLLSFAKDSDILKEAIRTKEMIDAISKEFPVRKLSVLDAQWTAVSQLVNAGDVAALTGKLARPNKEHVVEWNEKMTSLHIIKICFA